MQWKYSLLIILGSIVFTCSQENDITPDCMKFDEQQAFLRGYFVWSRCFIISNSTKNEITLNGEYTFTSDLPVFWTSEGISSQNSFCLYKLTELNQLFIKIYVTSETILKEYLIEAMEIKSVSTYDNGYSFYVINLEGSCVFYYITQDKISQIVLPLVPKLYSLNKFVTANDNCIYQIVSFSENLTLSIESVFCYEQDIQEIQCQIDGVMLIWSAENIITFVNNVISQIQPLTNIIIVAEYESSFKWRFLDLSELFVDEPNLYEYNNNYELYRQERYLFSKLDRSSANGQRVSSIDKFTINATNGNGNSKQSYLEQTNNTQLYMVSNQYQLTIYSINEVDSAFSYYQIYTNYRYSKIIYNSYFFLELSLFQSISCFITSVVFILLIISRFKHRKEIITRIEDLLFQKVLKISKLEFEKKYQIDFRDSLGSGSFGEVYKVKNKHKDIIKNPEILQNMPDYYACKQLFFSDSQQNSQISIQNEIDVLEKLKKYDNIIKLQNYIIENRSTLLILDLAESTLQEEINEKQINFEKYNEVEVVRFLTQIGKTLAIIYSNEGITHCDIKPSNILIREGNYYLSDFGCAQEIYQSNNLRDNIAMGTLKWMSPEVREYQYQHSQSIDFFKSDVFSLGMVLLYMLTLTDISQVNSDEFNRENKKNLLNRRKDEIHESIILLIKKMLEMTPDNRPDASILKTSIEQIEEKIKQKEIRTIEQESNSSQSEEIFQEEEFNSKIQVKIKTSK